MALELSESTPARIALLVPNLTDGGGVPSVARFLVHAIQGTGDLRCSLISLATSASDPASVRVANPRSWIEGPRVKVGKWEGHTYSHVGARFVELEFQRYRPRPALSRLLRGFDLVQVVSGSPAFALVARHFHGPVALQVATLARVERRERALREGGPLGLWRRTMTAVTSRLERAGARVPDRIFVENDWMRRTLGSWIRPERVILAPPGVDTGLFHPPRSPARSQNEGGYILSVGRFADPRKNVRFLIEAFARLKARTETDVKLVLAGESAPSGADLDRASELGIGGAVIWKGRVTEAQLALLYRGALAFVLSSTEEGLGLVLLEAMASGLSVVATRTEGARQVVEEGATGFLVDHGDAAGLAAGMEAVLKDARLRRGMGRRARRLVETNYSFDVTGKVFVDTYRELLRRRDRERRGPVTSKRV